MVAIALKLRIELQALQAIGLVQAHAGAGHADAIGQRRLAAAQHVVIMLPLHAQTPDQRLIGQRLRHRRVAQRGDLRLHRPGGKRAQRPAQSGGGQFKQRHGGHFRV